MFEAAIVLAIRDVGSGSKLHYECLSVLLSNHSERIITALPATSGSISVRFR
jgi:hypothetical protein